MIHYLQTSSLGLRNSILLTSFQTSGMLKVVMDWTYRACLYAILPKVFHHDWWAPIWSHCFRVVSVWDCIVTSTVVKMCWCSMGSCLIFLLALLMCNFQKLEIWFSDLGIFQRNGRRLRNSYHSGSRENLPQHSKRLHRALVSHSFFWRL